MATTVDQVSSTTTTATMTSTPLITHSNNVHVISVVDGGPKYSHFGVYQQMTVGSGDLLIRTFVLAAISAVPCRKVLIAKRFFSPDLCLHRYTLRLLQRLNDNSRLVLFPEYICH